MKIPIVVLFSLVVVAGCRHSDEPDEKPVVAVKVVRTELADVPLSVEAPATIFGRSQANVAARITAPIVRLNVKKGDDVKAGQVLAELERRDLRAEQAAASANLTDAEASLEKTSKGTLPADLQRARSELSSSQAALNLAQKIYDRRAELFQEGAISERELQTSEAELARAKSSNDVARLNLDVLEHQTRGNDMTIAESRVAEARAQSELAQADLSFAQLKSPMNGTITEQFMYPGDMAKPDLPVFSIADLSFAVAHVEVPESQAGQIARGQSCSFTGPDSATGMPTGKVTVVNQAVDSARRTIEVWCEIPNPKRVLKAGSFGVSKILVGNADRTIVVPMAAIQFEEGTTHGKVYVVDRQQIAHVREVEAVPSSDVAARITKGLSAGEIVIVEGGYGLPDGTKVSFIGAGK